MTLPRITIFISHAKDDETLAIALKKFLENIFLNADFFVSGFDLGGGDIWIEQLRQKLEAATAIIALMTPYSVDSKWVYFEAGAGFTRRRSIPLLVDGVTFQTLSPPLSLMQGRMYDDQGLKTLVSDISELAGLRAPVRYPGLGEVLIEAKEFIAQRIADQNKLTSSPIVSESKKSIFEENGDPDLSNQANILARRSHNTLISAIQKNKEAYDIPDDLELQKMNLLDLHSVADSIGLDPPFLITMLAMMLLQIPKTTDLKWKKQNFQSQLSDIEKKVEDFENKYAINH